MHLVWTVSAIPAIFPCLLVKAVDDAVTFQANTHSIGKNPTETDTETERGLMRDCWGAVGFFPYSGKSCIWTDETAKNVARKRVRGMKVGRKRCVKRSVRTFNDGCAALVWSKAQEDKNKALGFALGTEGMEAALEKAKKRCIKKAQNENNCGQQEWVCSICPRPVVGRPFVDSERKILHADAIFVKDASWTAIKPNMSTDANICHGNQSLTEDVAPNADVGSAWVGKGLDEHSSIASFAAFTLQLMANAAPPDLIRDSLLAALDEVNHAISSFEVASYFTGQHVGPGALPASSHKFQADMTSLAQSTAREGCVDETLSALVAAAEVDEFDREASADAGSRLRRERLAAIALDEARHASLAWRTVRWACLQDEIACSIVKRDVLNPGIVSLEAKRRDPSGALDGSFARILMTLIPLLVSSVERTDGVEKGQICGGNPMEEEPESGNFTTLLAMEIIKGVLCVD